LPTDNRRGGVIRTTAFRRGGVDSAGGLSLMGGLEGERWAWRHRSSEANAPSKKKVKVWRSKNPLKWANRQGRVSGRIEGRGRRVCQAGPEKGNERQARSAFSTDQGWNVLEAGGEEPVRNQHCPVHSLRRKGGNQKKVPAQGTSERNLRWYCTRYITPGEKKGGEKMCKPRR